MKRNGVGIPGLMFKAIANKTRAGLGSRIGTHCNQNKS